METRLLRSMISLWSTKNCMLDGPGKKKKADKEASDATEKLAKNELDNENLRTQKNQDESDCKVALHELEHNINLVNQAIKRFATNQERDGNKATAGHQTKIIKMLEELEKEYTDSSVKRKTSCTKEEKAKAKEFSNLAKDKAMQESRLKANSDSSKRFGEKLTELETSTENLEEEWTQLEERFARMTKQCAGDVKVDKMTNLATNYEKPSVDANAEKIKTVVKDFDKRHQAKFDEREQDIKNLEGAKTELTKALKENVRALKENSL